MPPSCPEIVDPAAALPFHVNVKPTPAAVIPVIDPFALPHVDGVVTTPAALMVGAAVYPTVNGPALAVHPLASVTVNE